MNIEEFGERIRSLDINNIIDEAIEEKKDFILDLIRSQLLKGERKDGSSIGEYSDSNISREYVQFKIDRGLFPVDTNGSYNLLFNGNFYASLVITIKGDIIEVGSTDPKLQKIEVNTGNLDDALELSEENLGILRAELLPIIQNKLHDQLGI